SPLTFTPSNWNVFQDVTVAGVDDPDVGDEHVTVTAASTGLPSKDVTVTVTDDDVLGIVPSTSAITLGEAGSATFRVRLSAMPSSDVTVRVTSTDTGAATVGPASLTFTPATWNVDQTVTV